MQAMSACAPVRDIRGEPGTHAGGMLERVRKVMASLTDHEMSAIYIQDLLAVDTFIPRKVQGGMAGECAMENAVGMAAMVKADRLQMQVIAREPHRHANRFQLFWPTQKGRRPAARQHTAR